MFLLSQNNPKSFVKNQKIAQKYETFIPSLVFPFWQIFLVIFQAVFYPSGVQTISEPCPQKPLDLVTFICPKTCT